LKAAESRILDTQQKIDDENRRLADVSNGGYAQKQDECEKAANDAAAAQKEYNEHREGATGLREATELAQTKATEAAAPLGRKEREIGQAEDQLRNLMREGGSRQSGFNAKITELVKAIQQEGSFESPPVGPIGHHVTLLKPKWSSIVERLFGATLTSFIVSSKKDMQLLSNIMRGIRW
jgi:chromosome segregation ATPase